MKFFIEIGVLGSIDFMSWPIVVLNAVYLVIRHNIYFQNHLSIHPRKLSAQITFSTGARLFHQK